MMPWCSGRTRGIWLFLFLLSFWRGFFWGYSISFCITTLHMRTECLKKKNLVFAVLQSYFHSTSSEDKIKIIFCKDNLMSSPNSSKSQRTWTCMVVHQLQFYLQTEQDTWKLLICWVKYIILKTKHLVFLKPEWILQTANNIMCINCRLPS